MESDSNLVYEIVPAIQIAIKSSRDLICPSLIPTRSPE